MKEHDCDNTIHSSFTMVACTTRGNACRHVVVNVGNATVLPMALSSSVKSGQRLRIHCSTNISFSYVECVSHLSNVSVFRI